MNISLCCQREREKEFNRNSLLKSIFPHCKIHNKHHQYAITLEKSTKWKIHNFVRWEKSKFHLDSSNPFTSRVYSPFKLKHPLGICNNVVILDNIVPPLIWQTWDSNIWEISNYDLFIRWSDVYELMYSYMLVRSFVCLLCSHISILFLSFSSLVAHGCTLIISHLTQLYLPTLFNIC